MRRNRLAAAGLAGLIGIAMLVTGPVPSSADPAGTNVVISQVQSRAPNVDPHIANAVELYNPTDTAIGIAEWEIIFYNSNGTEILRLEFDLGTEVPPLGHILVKDPNFMPAPMEPSMVQLPGRVFEYTPLGGTTDELPDAFGVELENASDAKVDGVATAAGATAALEGDPAQALDSTTDTFNASIRRDITGLDSNNNLDDFQRRLAGWGAQIG